MNQYEKIKALCAGGDFVCQKTFWDNYIRSPHKRRKELERMGYIWETRKCEHGMERSYDYKLIKVEPLKVAVQRQMELIK